MLTALVLVLLGIAVFDGDLDSSIWQGLGAGLQRWLVLAAGVTMVPTFGPMLITNGVTRGRLATSAIVTMVLVAATGTLAVTVGYAMEDVGFGLAGWPHELDEGGDAGRVRFLAENALQLAPFLAAWFVSGWLIGTGFYRFDKDAAVPLIVPSALPAVAAEVLVQPEIGHVGLPGFGVLAEALDEVASLDLAASVPATIAVVAVACAVATRYTRDVALRG